jgi:hypothetical protein
MGHVSPSGTEYLSCAETAKLVRAALKQAFPGIKFSVRSSTYSGGASIDVSWTDGPPAAEVEKVSGVFAGADFDGSIDLKCHTDHWLNPDGAVTVAHAQGTENSRGYLPEVIGDPPSPNARLVSFGADYVFCRRDFSDELTVAIRGEICEAANVYALDMSQRYEVAVIDGHAVPCHGADEYPQDLFYRLAAVRDGRQVAATR